MATFHPDISKSRIVFPSAAEEQFYNACRQSLSDKWQVYYSCTLSAFEDDKGLVDNEIDFVLYHPRLGIVVVEVKGGQIGYDPQHGRFHSINRHGERFEIKNPFQQALTWKSRFLRFLKKQNIRVPISQAVCFPGASEAEFPTTAGLEPALIIGRRRMGDVEQALKEIVAQSQPERFLQFDDVGKEIDRVLRGAHFATKMHIRDYITTHELRVKDVEVIHETFITPIASAPRIAIEGEAGTGKTMLAMMLAKHFRDLGRKVLLLSSNPLLTTYLNGELGSKIDVMTYAELASTFGIEILRRPTNFDGTREDWIQFVGPEKLREAISKTESRYQVVLCDEAQDVQPFWWESIESVVAPGPDSRFYVFFDRSQGVFGSGDSDTSFVPEDVLPIKPAYFPLVHNYRTTREIADFSRQFRTGKEMLHSHTGRIGYAPQIITYKDAADCRRLIGELAKRLFEQEGLRSNEVHLLSARKPVGKGSVFDTETKAGSYELVDLGLRKAKTLPGPDELKGKLAASTITGFKGLETAVGIVVNLSEYNLPLSNPIMSSLLYVAATRAKHMLYIFVQEQDEKVKLLRAALEKVEHAGGGMVVEAGAKDGEYLGEVVHYNPERVGWLKVKDPGFDRSNIMFFPHDVAKAKLAELQVGAAVRFRPRVEGHITIACDLKPA